MSVLLNIGNLRQHHDRFLQQHADMVSAVLHDAGVVALAEVAVHPGFKPKTGKLQAAIGTKFVRTRSGKVVRISDDKGGTGVRYARAIEQGAKPHKIVARNGKSLRFVSKSGALVFRRFVNHPGNKPYWFLRNATRVAGASAERQLAIGMRRLGQQFGR